jgi:hypothetical protein
MAVGTLFTLFVVPVFYLLIGRDFSRRAPSPTRASTTNPVSS